MQEQIPTFPPGWKVFPCHPGTKKPIPDAWQDAATDNMDVVNKWALDNPGCNWAVAMGPSGLAALDLDGGEIGEESLFQFELEFGQLPETREQTTPGGGRHLIFSDPGATLRNSVGKLGPKLDTRGQTGYILIAPSIIDGKPYVVTHDRPIADLPQFVQEALGRRAEHVGAAGDVALDSVVNLGRARQLLADYIERNHVAVSGRGGNSLTYVVAATILNLGLSEDKALEILEPWNAACDPPWDTEELRTLIANASTYAQNDAGAWSVPPASSTLSQEVLDSLPAQRAIEREEPARFKWMDEDEFTQMPPPEWLLKDIFSRDSIAMLYGPSGHYKSFIAMNLGAAVAQTGECAFYVAAEGISRMARKDFPAWKLAYAEDRKLPFYLVEDMPLADDQGDYVAFLDSIKAKAAGRTVGIIFIDTLNRAMLGLEENSAKDTAKVIHACLFLKKHLKCTVVVVHHTPKDGSDPRGSSALYAGFDTVLKVIADKAVKLARMWVTKQKTDEEKETPFCFEGKRFGPGLAFVPVDAKAAAILSDEMDIYSPKKISKALASLGEGARAPNWVSSTVLLDVLVPKLENETQQARKDSLDRCARGLLGAIKSKKLDGYHDGLGKDLRWSLP